MILGMERVQLQFLVATTDVDDEEMTKIAHKKPNKEEEVEQMIFSSY